eukprot:999421-Pelagomonas_calceolata.AAC.1
MERADLGIGASEHINQGKRITANYRSSGVFYQMGSRFDQRCIQVVVQFKLNMEDCIHGISNISPGGNLGA